MTVIELIEKLQFLLKNGFIKESDLVLLIGTGDVKSDYISSVVMPKVELLNQNLEEKKGYSHIGFMEV